MPKFKATSRIDSGLPCSWYGSFPDSNSTVLPILTNVTLGTTPILAACGEDSLLAILVLHVSSPRKTDRGGICRQDRRFVQRSRTGSDRTAQAGFFWRNCRAGGVPARPAVEESSQSDRGGAVECGGRDR